MDIQKLLFECNGDFQAMADKLVGQGLPYNYVIGRIEEFLGLEPVNYDYENE